MCVIITTPDRAHRPALRDLTLCEEANKHGSGLAWLHGRRVEYVKNLSAPEIHKQLRRVEGPAIAHFRIASVGGVHADLCHPFPVTHRAPLHARGRARAVLFHNGTWAEHRRAAEHFGIYFAKGEPVSDTRIAAALVARFGFSWLKHVRAEYCRWALLDARGIQRLGTWSRVGRCHFSNLHWNPEPPFRGRGADWWKQDFFGDEQP